MFFGYLQSTVNSLCQRLTLKKQDWYFSYVSIQVLFHI